MRMLKDWGIVIPVAGEEGGNQPTTYIMDMEALHRFLVAKGCNPTKEFRQRLMWRSDLEPGPYRGAVRGAVNDMANTPDRGAVNTEISNENQCDSQNQSTGPTISPFYREPSRGRISSLETSALLPAVSEALAKKDAENKLGSSLPPDLDGDLRAYLNLIVETGGTTYGHVAAKSGMGGTRASLAEEELLRRGLITRAPFGKTVAR